MMRDFIGAGFLAPFLPSWPEMEQGQRFHFESLGAMADYIPEQAPRHAWHRDTWEDGNTAWNGTRTLAEARSMAHTGWTDGAERVRAIAERITLAQPQRPRVARWDVAGAVASIPRHLAGNPLAMRRIVTDDTRRRPVLTLISLLAAPGGVDAAAFIQSAAIAAALVDRLETAGFRCEVLGVNRSYDHPNRSVPAHLNPRATETAFIAKRAEEPVDLAALAYSLGHPAISRRLTFCVMQIGKPTRRDGSGMGAAMALDTHPERPATTFVLPIPGTYTGNDLEAFQQACTALRRQDCPGIPEDLAA